MKHNHTKILQLNQTKCAKIYYQTQKKIDHIYLILELRTSKKNGIYALKKLSLHFYQKSLS